MVVVRVFHFLLFEGISSASLLVPKTVPPTLIVLLSTALSSKACDGRTLGFSFLCFSPIKTFIFLTYSFSIFIVIREVVLPPFEFVFCPPDFWSLRVRNSVSYETWRRCLWPWCYTLHAFDGSKVSINCNGFKKSLILTQFNMLKNFPDIGSCFA